MRTELVALISGVICGAIGFYFGYDYGHKKGSRAAVDLANDFIKDYKERNDKEKEELENTLKILTPDTNKTDYTEFGENSYDSSPAFDVKNNIPDENGHVNEPNVFQPALDRMVKTPDKPAYLEGVDEELMRRAWGDMFIEGRTESFGIPELCSSPDKWNEVTLGPDDYPEWIHAESKWSQEAINAKAYPPPYLYDPDAITAWVMGDVQGLMDVPDGIVHTAISLDMYLDRVDFVNPEFSEEVILTHRGAEPEEEDEEAYDVNDVWGLIGPESGVKMAYLCQELRKRDDFQIGLINEAMGLAIECHVYAMGGTDFEKGASD